MSKDTDDQKFDPKVHTLAKLHEILDDIYLEYACAYIFYYNMILNMKEKNLLTEDKIENIKAQVEHYTTERDAFVCKRQGITSLFLESWVRKYKNDA